MATIIREKPSAHREFTVRHPVVFPLPSVQPRAVVALALCAGLALSGCQRGGEHGAPAGGMPPAMVSVITAQPETVPVDFEYTGQTVGVRDVEIRARVTGILQKRLYAEGRPVAAGAPMFQIDPAPFQAALDKVEAELARAEAELERARREAARLKPLAEARAISRKELDDAVSAEAIAAAQVLAARAQVSEARLNLGYTRVEAPISGLSGRAQKSEGSLVSGVEATLLTTVSQLDPIQVLFGIAEGDRLKLDAEVAAGRLRLPANGRFEVAIRLADGSLHGKRGHLDFSDHRVHPETGTLEGRAELPNPGGRLSPGQFVRVILSGATRPDAILVPQRAVMEGPAGKFVYVIGAEDKAEPRPVEVGDWHGDRWLIHGGLRAGDRVIVDGALKVMPGAPVQIGEPAPPAGAAPAPGGQS